MGLGRALAAGRRGIGIKAWRYAQLSNLIASSPFWKVRRFGFVGLELEVEEMSLASCAAALEI